MFIVNDNIDIALLVDADGVHVGQDDLPPSEVRKLIGDDKIIGLSTHSPEQGKKAFENPDAPESIHLCDYPVVDETVIDRDLEDNMEEVLQIVTLGRASCRERVSSPV